MIYLALSSPDRPWPFTPSNVQDPTCLNALSIRSRMTQALPIHVDPVNLCLPDFKNLLSSTLATSFFLLYAFPLANVNHLSPLLGLTPKLNLEQLCWATESLLEIRPFIPKTGHGHLDITKAQSLKWLTQCLFYATAISYLNVHLLWELGLFLKQYWMIRALCCSYQCPINTVELTVVFIPILIFAPCRLLLFLFLNRDDRNLQDFKGNLSFNFMQ